MSWNECVSVLSPIICSLVSVYWRKRRRKKKQLYPETLKQSTFLSLFCCESNGWTISISLLLVCRRCVATHHHPTTKINKLTHHQKSFANQENILAIFRSSQAKAKLFFVALLFYLPVCLRLPRFWLQTFQKRCKTNGNKEHCFKIATLKHLTQLNENETSDGGKNGWLNKNNN